MPGASRQSSQKSVGYLGSNMNRSGVMVKMDVGPHFLYEYGLFCSYERANTNISPKTAFKSYTSIWHFLGLECMSFSELPHI